ncbi:MAG TPA: isochorismate synthase [Candidatus Deferrimicrobium sp.]|nr:isochorismate synthase [Candidatus Deferrimicrobium sp.]
MSAVAAASPALARRSADPAGPAVYDALRAALAAAAGRARPTLVSAVLPAATVDPVAVYAAAEAAGHERSLWRQPSEGFVLVGVGAAWSMRASGPGRFTQVAEAWSDLAGQAIITGDPGLRGCGPLLLGGFGFADVPARTRVWRGFEAADVVLPALLLSITPEGTWLTASHVLSPGETAASAGGTLASWWVHLIGSAVASSPPSVRPSLRLVASRPGAADWRASVSRLAGAVGRGRLDKVVLARQVDLVAESAIDVPAVLERLRATAPESTLFAIGRGGRTFLGATPERLVSLDGCRLRSVAMAGSTRRGDDAAADERLAAELLGSDKEREEHAVVVDMLRATLAPLTDELAIPSVPHVEQLHHLQHLVTPVEGRLREPSGVLRFAELLHPTPAVGGMPRDLALDLIAEEEAHERGWYAGPLGWLDRSGDGELVVALRSGVVEDRTATLLAGCGIVADSDPEREWQESTTKLLALGSALGRVEA